MTDAETMTRMTAHQQAAIDDAAREMGPAIAMMKRHAQRAISAGHPAAAVVEAMKKGAVL